ncbi:translocon-associated protein TRAP alpha subunit [Heterostelium album PN500]|uniref:Translocon-associated protein TRAP alpha subunit n=1 Tax=Heterostelium pallidum (strain ATCC 26659 / Pp 5 / PN500) TaxID=670386 RepID=D3BP56_HETP5|nr:translocon-associated protein TRAP alpha subunit [Heterostelium album PN500]EFA77066.1 translocon-associated protein TRAP alpha subunit [Heterostelium album PN500]|eukprot:XP_020429195.1 translocon-associated protein TRAP alpha subunit [Heterostelium album PN500]
MNKLAVCILSFVIFAFAAVAIAEDVEVVTETVATGPSDVSFSYIFPDYPNKEFPAGSVIEVLVGFSNNAEVAYNVSGIFASLNHPQEMKYYIQNYTRGEYGIAVQPGQHTTLAYRFVPDALLDPRQFGLLISMDYQNELQNFTQTFFNSTVLITEKPSTFDLEQFFLILFAVGIVGLVVFLVQGKLPKSKKPRSNKSTSSTSSSSVVSSDDTSDWLEGTSATSPKLSAKKAPSANKKEKLN